MSDERYHDDEYEYAEEGPCPECGDGEFLQSACIDDLCHGGEVPCRIHGDWSTLPCSLCGKLYR